MNSGQPVLINGFAVKEQAADKGRFSVIHTSRGGESEQILILNLCQQFIEIQWYQPSWFEHPVSVEATHRV